jgi:hypothetical protein
MNTMMDSTVEELEQAEQVLQAPTREVREAYHEEVTFTYPVRFVERRVSDEWDELPWEEYTARNQRQDERREADSVKRLDGPERREIAEELGAQIATGILWIPPFVNDFWTGRRKKPKPTKCVCDCCGNKHSLKERA